MKIIVNGTSVDIDRTDINYEDLVKLAGKRGCPSVTYSSRGTGDAKRSGSLSSCQSLRLDEGMVFTILHTGNA